SPGVQADRPVRMPPDRREPEGQQIRDLPAGLDGAEEGSRAVCPFHVGMDGRVPWQAHGGMACGGDEMNVPVDKVLNARGNLIVGGDTHQAYILYLAGKKTEARAMLIHEHFDWYYGPVRNVTS